MLLLIWIAVVSLHLETALKQQMVFVCCVYSSGLWGARHSAVQSSSRVRSRRLHLPRHKQVGFSHVGCDIQHKSSDNHFLGKPQWTKVSKMCRTHCALCAVLSRSYLPGRAVVLSLFLWTKGTSLIWCCSFLCVWKQNRYNHPSQPVKHDLVTIGCVFNHKSLYANVQVSEFVFVFAHFSCPFTVYHCVEVDHFGIGILLVSFDFVRNSSHPLAWTMVASSWPDYMFCMWLKVLTH